MDSGIWKSPHNSAISFSEIKPVNFFAILLSSLMPKQLGCRAASWKRVCDFVLGIIIHSKYNALSDRFLWWISIYKYVTHDFALTVQRSALRLRPELTARYENDMVRSCRRTPESVHSLTQISDHGLWTLGTRLSRSRPLRESVTFKKMSSCCFKLNRANRITFNASNVGNFFLILKDCVKVQEKKREVVVLCSRPLQNVKLGIFTS